MKQRGSGILLHVTSLPSDFGIGDLGPSAMRFADYLLKAGQRFWQILPLNPTQTFIGNSPYSSYSAFAGNPILISPEHLLRKNLLENGDLKDVPSFPQGKTDYQAVTEYKNGLFKTCVERNKDKILGDSGYWKFWENNRYWLDDFSLFRVLKDKFSGRSWTDWPQEWRDRHPEALAQAKTDFKDEILYEKIIQFIFYSQWEFTKEYFNKKGISIIGDVPIYTTHDSSDVWANPELFRLDETGNPVYVAGVPPDYFSETGQRWGNPVFDWKKHEQTGFEWWLKRIGFNLSLFDFVRLDHFRGFEAYWEIPAQDETAVNGTWIEAPREKLFKRLHRLIPYPAIIAEDLGVITPGVREIKNMFDFPGMKILQFAFGDHLPESTDAPHNYERNCVAYTGTHDNNTIRGWYVNEAGEDVKERITGYLGFRPAPESVHWDMIRACMTSVANLTVFPMQDVLGLDEKARMNTPSVTDGNWGWRAVYDDFNGNAAEKLLYLTRLTGRF